MGAHESESYACSSALKSGKNYAATTALYEKYRFIPRVVANLDSTQLSHMLRSSADPLTFFPAIGLFAHEFAIGYCVNQSLKRQLNPKVTTGNA